MLGVVCASTAQNAQIPYVKLGIAVFCTVVTYGADRLCDSNPTPNPTPFPYMLLSFRSTQKWTATADSTVWLQGKVQAGDVPMELVRPQGPDSLNGAYYKAESSMTYIEAEGNYTR